MKMHIMHRDRDFDLQHALPNNAQTLQQDLELDTLLRAMANDDEFLLDVAWKAVLTGLDNDVDTILYRQAILQDCLNNPDIVRALYDLSVEAIEIREKSWLGIFSNYPGATLRNAVAALELFTGMLRKLRNIAEKQKGRFSSEGFKTLFTMIREELNETYLTSIDNHLTELKFRRGVLISAELGEGNKSARYVLREATGKSHLWLNRILGTGAPAYTFRIPDRDEAGAMALSELKNRGINLVANALAQSSEHVLGFFRMMRAELAFYVGCLNLHDRLTAMNATVCFPTPSPLGGRQHDFSGLYDVCLALGMKQPVVSNAINANDRSLVVITGANKGGKSSFLRGIGLAQLMMQCGMFVAADAFTAELCSGLFTHYKREEDPTMNSGKFDEELGRMSDIADHIRPDSLMLFNEPFAATNEREGSEIARQIVCALLERRVKVFFVTHMYEFAHAFFAKKMKYAMFLHAERQADGARTFKLIEGEPSATSYGEDVYKKIFADTTDVAGTA